MSEAVTLSALIHYVTLFGHRKYSEDLTFVKG